MISYEDFQMEMAKLFNMFTLGDAVIKVNNPDELYMMYEMFQDTSIIFCNTNRMTEVDLIASVAQNRLRCLDLSKDRAMGRGLLPAPEHRLKTRALYYYLKEGNFGFKGFPVYLHVLYKWDDSKYAVDPTMVMEMNIPQNYLRQVEFMYAQNQDLGVLNEMNPMTMNILAEGNSSGLWDEVCPEVADEDEFIPLMLVHRLNEKRRYPIAIIPNLGLHNIQYMAYTYNQALVKCSVFGIDFINQIIRSFTTLNPETGAIDTCSLLGSSDKESTAMSLVIANDLLIVMSGGACFRFEKKEHFDVFAALFDFQSFDLVSAYQVPQDPVTQEMIPFWFWFDEWRHVQMMITEHPSELVELKFTEDHCLAYKAIDERMMYALNAVQNLTLSMPCFGGTLPPRFIWALRDIIIEEKDREKVPPEAKED